MDPQFLFKILSPTSISSDEIKEFLNQYMQTYYAVVLERMLAFMEATGQREELDKMRVAFEGLEKIDRDLEEIAEGKEGFYNDWQKVLEKSLDKNSFPIILKSIDKAVEELDNDVIENLLDRLSVEDREKVSKKIDIMMPL